jgi:hypothetical protein
MSPRSRLPALALAATLVLVPTLAAALPFEPGPSVPAARRQGLLSLLGELFSRLWAAETATGQPDTEGGTNNSDNGMLIDPHG